MTRDMDWLTFMLAFTALGLQIGWWQTLGFFIVLLFIDFAAGFVEFRLRAWRRYR